MGSAAIGDPQTSSSSIASGVGNNSTLSVRARVRSSNSTLRPRTGSIDLALGVGVGMFIGGAAVFVLMVTIRNRRLHRPQNSFVNGGGAGGFGYDGVRLHGAGRGGRGGGMGGSVTAGGWPRRRRSFPVGGGVGKRTAAGAKEVAIELGRGGLDYDAYNDEEAFASLTLEQKGLEGRGGEENGGTEASGGMQSNEALKGSRRASQEGAKGRNGRGGKRTGWLSTHEEAAVEEGSQQALLGDGSEDDFM